MGAAGQNRQRDVGVVELIAGLRHRGPPAVPLAFLALQPILVAVEFATGMTNTLLRFLECHRAGRRSKQLTTDRNPPDGAPRIPSGKPERSMDEKNADCETVMGPLSGLGFVTETTSYPPPAGRSGPTSGPATGLLL